MPDVTSLAEFKNYLNKNVSSVSICIVNFSFYIMLILIFAFAFCKWLLCSLTVNKGAPWSTAILDVNPVL